MIRNLVILMAVVDLLIGAGASYAWARRGGGAPPYSLTIARPLEEKSWAFQANDLDRLQGWLAADVEKALVERREDGKPALKLKLVLEDARPSRSLRVAVPDRGGAASLRGGVTISGDVTRADGRTTPILYKAYRKPGRTSPPENWADARAAFRVFAGMIVDDTFGRCAAGCSRTRAWKAAA